MEWNYISKEKKSTGYEDIHDYLKTFNSDRWKNSSDIEKENMIDEVVNIYMSRNILPILYFNEDGVKEEIQKCIDYQAEIKGNILNTGQGIGTALCNFFMPNMYEAYNKHNGMGTFKKFNQSVEWKFTYEPMFRRVVRFAIQCHGDATEEGIVAGLRRVSPMPTNFRPMNAQAIYERYCPENGIIHDPSCGFGGRLLGALTSKNNYKYVGTEPNSKTVKNLVRFGREIEKVTGRTNSFRIIQKGSEDFKGTPGIFDISFSSPPYFDLEHYSDETTQCYNKFRDIYTWFDGFVYPTIKNAYIMLKRDRYYAVNIADFNSNGRRVNFIDTWCDLAEKCGFKYRDELFMKLNTYSNQYKKVEGMKQERVLIFYKE